MPRLSSKWAEFGRAAFRARLAQAEEQRLRYSLDNAASEDEAAAAGEALGRAVEARQAASAAIDSIAAEIARGADAAASPEGRS